jgi:hypothetical protein
VAVGSVEFVASTQAVLGLRGRNLEIAENEDVYVLREAEENYSPVFGVENRPIGP